ncbi:MAG: SRPBCC family protein [Burkholderiaceae bacterium]
MTSSSVHQPDARLDLVLERVVDVPRKRIWAAWTQPELLKKWFTPAPWITTECEMNLRPGGVFRTVMRSPEGAQFDNVGCLLEIVEDEKLVWTGALGPGFRPRSTAPEAAVPFVMTAIIALADAPGGTRYTATVIHGDEGARAQHEQMGFHRGWSAALDQLVALAKTM